MSMFQGENVRYLDIYALAAGVGSCQYSFNAIELCDKENALALVSKSKLDLLLQAQYRHTRVVLSVLITGNVFLVCQRCLEPYEFGLNIERNLVVVDSPFETVEFGFEDCEPIEKADKTRINLNKLVFDEVILSLPTIPKHPDGHCELVVAKFAEYC